nr:MAG TPA: hypothetical protein [Caudoviricetes sp.]
MNYANYLIRKTLTIFATLWNPIHEHQRVT